MATFEVQRSDILPFERERGRAGRPSFSSMKTSDRLRECERRPSVVAQEKKQALKRSVFKEEGLDDLSTSVYRDLGETDLSSPIVPIERRGTGGSGEKKRKFEEQEVEKKSLRENHQRTNTNEKKAFWKLGRQSRPMVRSSATAPAGAFSTIPRIAMLAFLIAIVVPGLRNRGSLEVGMNGADAGVIRKAELVDNASSIEGRADSPTDVCTRWAHQVANVNGTLYIYGGQAKTSSGQTQDTWSEYSYR